MLRVATLPAASPAVRLWYLTLADRLFSAAAEGDRGRAFRIEYGQIDPLFDAIVRRVRAAAKDQRHEALVYERGIERSNEHLIAVLAAVWCLGAAHDRESP